MADHNEREITRAGIVLGVPCLAADADDPSSVLAGADEGMYRSTDLGNKWQKRSCDNIAGIERYLTDQSVLYAFTEEGGMHTENRGEPWSVIYPVSKFVNDELRSDCDQPRRA